MLEKGLIYATDCKALLRATRHVPSSVLQQHLDMLEEVYRHVQFPTETKRQKYLKGCVLSAIGLWNSTKQFSYKQIQSYYEIDAGRGVKQRKRMEDGSFVFTSYTELVGLFSMAPWGRIALDIEQLRIAQALEVANQKPDHVQVVGAHVDGVFMMCHSVDPPAICEWMAAQHKWADGEPIFHIKDEPVCKVPMWSQEDINRSQALEFKRPVWKDIYEENVPDRDELMPLLLELILKHQGLLLSGAAGTGKSHLLRALMKLLSSKVPGKHIATALRHNTTMLICGKTIAHYLHKYRSRGGAPRPGTIVVIDEWSEVQLHTWAELAQWKLVGVIFVLVGDADGQRKPIFDKWQDAMDSIDIRRSQLIHELCGGFHTHLSVYRRGVDQDLFDAYTGLYPLADDNSQVPRIVEQMRGKYPLPSIQTRCGYYLVLSHKKRMLLNHAMN